MIDVLDMATLISFFGSWAKYYQIQPTLDNTEFSTSKSIAHNRIRVEVSNLFSVN